MALPASYRRTRSPKGTPRHHSETDGAPDRRQGQEGIRQVADAGRAQRVPGTVVRSPGQEGTEDLRTKPIAFALPLRARIHDRYLSCTNRPQIYVAPTRNTFFDADQQKSGPEDPQAKHAI